MAWREKVTERAQAFVEPGETVRHVAVGQTGPSPYLNFVTYLVSFWAKGRILVYTERALLVLDSSIWTPTKPRKLLGRYPLQKVGEIKGLWAKLQIGGEKIWVHKRFQGELKAADAEIA